MKFQQILDNGMDGFNSEQREFEENKPAFEVLSKSIVSQSGYLHVL